jgi:hypothetical protein
MATEIAPSPEFNLWAPSLHFEKIQLTDKDPVIPGATLEDGYLWFCDEAGYICNPKL